MTRTVITDGDLSAPAVATPPSAPPTPAAGSPRRALVAAAIVGGILLLAAGFGIGRLSAPSVDSLRADHEAELRAARATLSSVESQAKADARQASSLLGDKNTAIERVRRRADRAERQLAAAKRRPRSAPSVPSVPPVSQPVTRPQPSRPPSGRRSGGAGSNDTNGGGGGGPAAPQSAGAPACAGLVSSGC